MNLYKSRIIKSESVRIVESQGDSLSAGEDAKSPVVVADTEAIEERFQQALRGAFEKGVAEGVRKGRDLQAHESASALKAAEDAVRQMSRLKVAIMEQSEDDILGLVFAIAEKVIHHEVTVNRDIVKGVLKSAVAAINDREHIRVKCNPADISELKDLRPELLGTIDGLTNVTFVEDAAIVRGGVKVETGIGEVDARIDKQFEVIKHAILS